MDTRTLITASQIADELGHPREEVRRIINTRNIDCVMRAGLTRLFNREAIGLVRKVLSTIRRRRSPGEALARNGKK